MTLPRPAVLVGSSPGHVAFQGREGRVTLLELFAGHRRLAVHHTLPDRVLSGSRAAPVRPPSALTDPDTRLVLVSRAPYSMVEQYCRHLGHELPCYSAPDGVFGHPDPGEPWEQVPVLSLFRRDGTTTVHSGTIALPGLGLLASTAGLPGLRAHC
jgi:hypothetical protein